MRMECYHQRHIVCKIYVIYYKKLEQKDVEQQRPRMDSYGTPNYYCYKVLNTKFILICSFLFGK